MSSPDDELRRAFKASTEEIDQETRFDALRKIAGLTLAPIAFAATYALTEQRLTLQGRPLAAVMSAACVLWVTEAIPLPVTALVSAALCVLLGVADVATVLARFADPIVFLFIGSFTLAMAMSVHGLDRRIALSFLSVPWISAHPARILAGIGTITALLSMWISNTATTAMMLPIALGILNAVHRVRQASGLAPPGPIDPRNWPFATGMLLMIAYAASIGGIGTPVGSPPNLVTINFVKQSTGIQITFFQWMELAVPLLIVMGIALFAILFLFHPSKRRSDALVKAASPGPDLSAASMAEYISQERAALGPWTRGQANTLFAFSLAVVLWTLPGFISVFAGSDSSILIFFNKRIPESMAALLAAILLFVLPTDLRRGQFTLRWSEATQIDWGTILLFGGGLSLGTLMFDTGVARTMAEGIVHLTGATSLWGLTAAAIAMGILISEATSNTAAANMIVPVAIAIAQTADVSPLPPALGACFGASYGFMLPVSTPPNAIVYGSGLVPITKMIRAGVVFDVVGFVIIFAGLRVLCPLLGLM